MTRVSFTYMGNHLNISHGVGVALGGCPSSSHESTSFARRWAQAIYKWSYNIVITSVYTCRKSDTSFLYLYLDTSHWKLLNQWLGSMRSQTKTGEGPRVFSPMDPNFQRDIQVGVPTFILDSIRPEALQVSHLRRSRH